ncbi:MAG: hypothetical protein IJT15_03755 [Rickettsiales bacterium]|nr:hypothetical protein [Rickettsiales bacterium]
MWLVDWLRDILPSCLKDGKKEIITKLPEEKNANIAGNSTQDNTGVVAKKRKQSVKKVFGTDNLKRRKIVSNQSDNINTSNVNIQNNINYLNVSMIQENNNEDDFIEPDDNEIQILIDIMNTTNKQAKQNKNCNNNVKLPLNLKNTSLNYAL